MSRKNFDILVSTTRQWNPGDEFIDKGARKILAPYLPPHCNWHLWNRNPDLSKHYKLDWHFRSDLVSNCTKDVSKNITDLVLFSGSPEWIGPRCDAIYEFLMSHPEVPLVMIGIGSADALKELKPSHIKVLSRENTVIITRSRQLSLEINNILGFDKSQPLPCPSVFSADSLADIDENGPVGLICQVSEGEQSIDTRHFDEIKEIVLHTNEKLNIIAFHEKECAILNREFPGFNIIYSHDSTDYYNILSQHRAIVSTRLHGALLSLSLGVPVFIPQRADYRVNSTADMVDYLLPRLPTSDAFQAAFAIKQPEANAFQSSVAELKNSLYIKYASLLRGLDCPQGNLGQTKMKLNKFPLDYDSGGAEVKKSYLERVQNGFFEKYYDGDLILDIGFKGSDNPDGKTIVPHAIGVDFGYPGYDGTKLPFEDNTVDCVSSSHCLEHVWFKESIIRDWYRVLKTGGYIVCIVPHQYLYEKRLFTPSVYNPDHKHFFTPSSLLKAFEDALEPNTYRVRHLRDNDRAFDYSIDPGSHSYGCYEIELVIQKIDRPTWSLFRN